MGVESVMEATKSGRMAEGGKAKRNTKDRHPKVDGYCVSNFFGWLVQGRAWRGLYLMGLSRLASLKR